MKWEYKVVRIVSSEIEAALNYLGAEEWELVSTFHDDYYIIVLYLKRPKSYPPKVQSFNT